MKQLINRYRQAVDSGSKTEAYSLLSEIQAMCEQQKQEYGFLLKYVHWQFEKLSKARG